MDSKVKRRDFLKISALAGVAVVVAACQPTATPTAAPTVASKATEVPKATAAPCMLKLKYNKVYRIRAWQIVRP